MKTECRSNIVFFAQLFTNAKRVNALRFHKISAPGNKVTEANAAVLYFLTSFKAKMHYMINHI